MPADPPPSQPRRDKEADEEMESISPSAAASSGSGSGESGSVSSNVGGPGSPGNLGHPAKPRGPADPFAPDPAAPSLAPEPAPGGVREQMPPAPFAPSGRTRSKSVSPSPASAKLSSLAAAAHGFYFVVMGLWPVVNLPTFEQVSGNKAEDWLAVTVGWLLTVIGLVLLLAALRRRVALEIFVLGIGTALALVGLDVVYVVTKTIPPVYVLDIVAEGLFIALWVFAARRERRKLHETSTAPEIPRSSRK